MNCNLLYRALVSLLLLISSMQGAIFNFERLPMGTKISVMNLGEIIPAIKNTPFKGVELKEISAQAVAETPGTPPFIELTGEIDLKGVFLPGMSEDQKSSLIMAARFFVNQSQMPSPKFQVTPSTPVALQHENRSLPSRAVFALNASPQEAADTILRGKNSLDNVPKQLLAVLGSETDPVVNPLKNLPTVIKKQRQEEVQRTVTEYGPTMPNWPSLEEELKKAQEEKKLKEELKKEEAEFVTGEKVSAGGSLEFFPEIREEGATLAIIDQNGRPHIAKKDAHGLWRVNGQLFLSENDLLKLGSSSDRGILYDEKKPDAYWKAFEDLSKQENVSPRVKEALRAQLNMLGRDITFKEKAAAQVEKIKGSIEEKFQKLKGKVYQKKNEPPLEEKVLPVGQPTVLEPTNLKIFDERGDVYNAKRNAQGHFEVETLRGKKIFRSEKEITGFGSPFKGVLYDPILDITDVQIRKSPAFIQAEKQYSDTIKGLTEIKQVEAQKPLSPAEAMLKRRREIEAQRATEEIEARGAETKKAVGESEETLKQEEFKSKKALLPTERQKARAQQEGPQEAQTAQQKPELEKQLEKPLGEQRPVFEVVQDPAGKKYNVERTSEGVLVEERPGQEDQIFIGSLVEPNVGIFVKRSVVEKEGAKTLKENVERLRTQFSAPKVLSKAEQEALLEAHVAEEDRRRQANMLRNLKRAKPEPQPHEEVKQAPEPAEAPKPVERPALITEIIDQDGNRHSVTKDAEGRLVAKTESGEKYFISEKRLRGKGSESIGVLADPVLDAPGSKMLGTSEYKKALKKYQDNIATLEKSADVLPTLKKGEIVIIDQDGIRRTVQKNAEGFWEVTKGTKKGKIFSSEKAIFGKGSESQGMVYDPIVRKEEAQIDANKFEQSLINAWNKDKANISDPTLVIAVEKYFRAMKSEQDISDTYTELVRTGISPELTKALEKHVALYKASEEFNKDLERYAQEHNFSLTQLKARNIARTISENVAAAAQKIKQLFIKSVPKAGQPISKEEHLETVLDFLKEAAKSKGEIEPDKIEKALRLADGKVRYFSKETLDQFKQLDLNLFAEFNKDPVNFFSKNPALADYVQGKISKEEAVGNFGKQPVPPSVEPGQVPSFDIQVKGQTVSVSPVNGVLRTQDGRILIVTKSGDALLLKPEIVNQKWVISPQNLQRFIEKHFNETKTPFEEYIIEKIKVDNPKKYFEAIEKELQQAQAQQKKAQTPEERAEKEKELKRKFEEALITKSQGEPSEKLFNFLEPDLEFLGKNALQVAPAAKDLGFELKFPDGKKVFFTKQAIEDLKKNNPESYRDLINKPEYFRKLFELKLQAEQGKVSEVDFKKQARELAQLLRREETKFTKAKQSLQKEFDRATKNISTLGGKIFGTKESMLDSAFFSIVLQTPDYRPFGQVGNLDLASVDLTFLKEIVLNECSLGLYANPGHSIYSLFLEGKLKIKNLPLMGRVLLNQEEGNRGIVLQSGLPENYKLSDSFPELKGFDRIEINKAYIYLSTINYVDYNIETNIISTTLPRGRELPTATSGVIGRPHVGILPGLTIRPGISVYGEINLRRLLPFLEHVPAGEIVGLERASMYGTVSFNPANLLFGIGLPDLIKIPNPEKSPLRSAGTWVEIRANANGDPQASFVFALVFTPTPTSEALTFTGRVTSGFEAGQVALSMQGFWNDVFGVKGLAIGDLAIQLDIDYVALVEGVPITGLGLAGALKLGSVAAPKKVSMKMLVDFAHMEQTVAQGKVDGELAIRDVIETSKSIALNAVQGVSGDNQVVRSALEKVDRDFTNILNSPVVKELVGISMKDVDVKVAPLTVRIGEFVVQQGFTMKGSFSLLGVTAGMNFNISSSGVAGEGFLSPINIANVFKLHGAPGDHYPNVPADAAYMSTVLNFADQHFYISGEVELLGMSQKTLLKLDKDGFKFHIDGKAFNLFEASIDAATRGDIKNLDFYIKGYLKNDFFNFLAQNVSDQLRSSIRGTHKDFEKAFADVEKLNHDIDKFGNDIQWRKNRINELNPNPLEGFKNTGELIKLGLEITGLEIAQKGAIASREVAKGVLKGVEGALGITGEAIAGILGLPGKIVDVQEATFDTSIEDLKKGLMPHVKVRLSMFGKMHTLDLQCDFSNPENARKSLESVTLQLLKLIGIQ